MTEMEKKREQKNLIIGGKATTLQSTIYNTNASYISTDLGESCPIW